MKHLRLSILLGCMAIVGGISSASTPLLCIGKVSDTHCQKNFTNVMEAQTFLEETLQIKERDITQTLPYTLFYDLLEQGCDAQVLEEAKKLQTLLQNAWTTTSTLRNRTMELEKRFTILKQLIIAIPTTSEQLFCKQKYLTYSLLEWSQKQYQGNNLSPTTKNTSTFTKEPEKTEASHSSAQTSPSETTPLSYLTLINHNSTLSDKADLLLSQLAEKYIQTEVGKLISGGFLTTKDGEVLSGKIEINYVKGCGTTHGSYHMTQRTDGSKRTFKLIKLNINLCNQQTYLENFNRYVRQIFIHELGHYLYYFKDPSTTLFDNLCRSSKRTCDSEDFVSTYAEKNKEEDYAESFAHWYIQSTTNTTMIVDQEHGSATTSPLRLAKERYFDNVYR